MPTTKKEKTCFVIMPISDHTDYDNGHFRRVYEHLIKPACEKAGYNAIRADDVASSNYIVIDILSKIVNSDMVLCDLSAKNPNVLYELGIRQAFNLPTVLIKDTKTSKIFDIQGLRYTDYSHSLRIDTVEKEINSIAKNLEETDKKSEKDVNSIIQLLGIQSAKIPEKVELSNDTTLIMNAINNLSTKINLVSSENNKSNNLLSKSITEIELQGFKGKVGANIFDNNGLVGNLVGISEQKIIVWNEDDNKLYSFIKNSKKFKELSFIPVIEI